MQTYTNKETNEDEGSWVEVKRNIIEYSIEIKYYVEMNNNNKSRFKFTWTIIRT